MSEEIKDDFDAFDDEPTSDVKLTPRSLLAVVRAAEEGTPTESLADAVAKLKTDVATLEAEAKAAVEEDGDGATPAAKAPPAAKEAPSKSLGLSAEGEVQAIGVAMDLSSILYGYQTRTARVFYNAESASASKTAAEIRDQLDDATMGLKRINVEMIGTLSADASAVFETLRDAKPEPGGRRRPRGRRPRAHRMGHRARGVRRGGGERVQARDRGRVRVRRERVVRAIEDRVARVNDRAIALCSATKKNRSRSFVRASRDCSH